MKRVRPLIIISILFIGTITLSGFDKSPSQKNDSISIKKDSIDDKNMVFQVVEKMPEYPGGLDELMKFISSNIKYPAIEQETAFEGKIIVRFIVEKDGSITNVEILRKRNSLFEEEAIRVVKLMPKWTPGIQNGKTARVYYILPIIFKLN